MPSVATEDLKALITLGPFAGLANTSRVRVPPGKLLAVSNIAPNRVGGAWVPMRGRSPALAKTTFLGTGPVLAGAKFITADVAYILAQTVDTASSGAPLPLI